MTDKPRTQIAAAFPRKADFAPMELAYLDSATMHPVSLGAKANAEAYLAARTFAGAGEGYFAGATEKRVLERFARLINAHPSEVCFVPGTTAAEHLVLAALDLPASGGRVVTDTLHFFGSYYLYDELAKRGAEVVWLRAQDGRIAMADLQVAVSRGVKLVAVSLVSNTNGFEHDLKAICDLAHAHGGLVFADIIQAAGCTPIDVKLSGVDFAACSSFKWLMGDFGLGMLYVRADLMPRLKRTQFGYYQLAAWRTPAFPQDPPYQRPEGYETTDDASGFFAMGTLPHAVLAQLDWSLDYILGLGVENIRAWRQPLLSRLMSELPRLGYRLLTPQDSTSAIVACALDDPQALAPRLAAAKVKIALARRHFRVSPSVFNDAADIERLLDALS
ncbi:aminotransferase class V-fold PLP-dependent enzyme [Phenylobacterium sp.]|uniref:aminotransferase class V-fold PLP-dependent enzyme n=1 Tax=Phenylobacterium sp. TaxID=1871053 RepID=UPI002F3FBD34